VKGPYYEGAESLKDKLKVKKWQPEKIAGKAFAGTTSSHNKVAASVLV